MLSIEKTLKIRNCLAELSSQVPTLLNEGCHLCKSPFWFLLQHYLFWTLYCWQGSLYCSLYCWQGSLYCSLYCWQGSLSVLLTRVSILLTRVSILLTRVSILLTRVSILLTILLTRVSILLTRVSILLFIRFVNNRRRKLRPQQLRPSVEESGEHDHDSDHHSHSKHIHHSPHHHHHHHLEHVIHAHHQISSTYHGHVLEQLPPVPLVSSGGIHPSTGFAQMPMQPSLLQAATSPVGHIVLNQGALGKRKYADEDLWWRNSLYGLCLFVLNLKGNKTLILPNK